MGHGGLGLAFDLDGPSGDALVDGSIAGKPGFFTFGGYGPHRVLPRLLEVLQNLNTSATFFTPAWVVRQWPELCRRIRDAGHEMAGHGDLHEMFYGRIVANQSDILERAQQTFTDVLGSPARGFRAPSGDIDLTTIDLLSKHGYSYSSSMRSGDALYRHANGLIEVPAKSLFDDYSAFAYHRAPDFPSGLDRIASYDGVFESWLEEILAATAEGLPVVSIWHPKIIGTPGRLLMVESLLTNLLADPGTPVRRCIDIVAAYEEETR